jgi:hypothetical protein
MRQPHSRKSCPTVLVFSQGRRHRARGNRRPCGPISSTGLRRNRTTAAALRMLRYDFRRGQLPDFFAVKRPGPRRQPKNDNVRDSVVEPRKWNLSDLRISRRSNSRGLLSARPPCGEILIDAGRSVAPPRRRTVRRPWRTLLMFVASAHGVHHEGRRPLPIHAGSVDRRCVRDGRR